VAEEEAADARGVVVAVVAGGSATRSGPQGKSGWATDTAPGGSRRSQPAVGATVERAGLPRAFEKAPGGAADAADAGRRGRRRGKWAVRQAGGSANADRGIPPAGPQAYQEADPVEPPSYWPAAIGRSSRGSTCWPSHGAACGEEP